MSQFKEFQEQFNHSALSAEALAEQMGNVDSSIIKYAKTCKNGEMTSKGFEQSLKGISLSAKIGKAASSSRQHRQRLGGLACPSRCHRYR